VDTVDSEEQTDLATSPTEASQSLGDPAGRDLKELARAIVSDRLQLSGTHISSQSEGDLALRIQMTKVRLPHEIVLPQSQDSPLTHPE